MMERLASLDPVLIDGNWHFPDGTVIPRIAGGALTNSIPTIWSARILEVLNKFQVMTSPAVVNRNWEGEIQRQGDTVKILGMGDPTVSNYTRNADLAAPETPADNTRSLVIDQAKYVNIGFDDLDAVQSILNVLDWYGSRAGYKFRDAADTFIGTKYVDAGTSSGTDAAPIQFLASNAYATMVNVSVALSTQNVPTEGRYAILPPWAVGIVAQAPEFVQYGQYANQTIVREGFTASASPGYRGRFAGFDIFESQNLTTVVNGSSQTVYECLCGTNAAITYAEQLNKTERLRSTLRFADLLRGLFVYGAKTVLPAALHNLKIRQ